MIGRHLAADAESAADVGLPAAEVVMISSWRIGALLAPSLLAATVAGAAPIPFFFSTGDPDGRMAMASRPGSAGKPEIETADDFVLSQRTGISSASFTGLLVGGSIIDLGTVRVEIYRVFPNDSNVGRTSGAPTFSTSNVPTRVNSPSDVAIDSRDSSGGLSFSTTSLGSFTASNSVAPGGIHAKPNQTTGGNGPVTGEEVEFVVTFATPFELDPDHYFFVPQVELTNGAFFWLSAPRPIVAPGTPFAPDLQTWTRDASLDPDWLRVGTDIVGGNPAPTFNAVFSLTGQANATVPEPGSPALVGLAAFALLAARGRGRSRA